jgi:hypothetical protein
MEQYNFPTILLVCEKIVEDFRVLCISEISGYIWGTAAIFWDVTPYILLEIYVRFGGTIRFHQQGRWPRSQKTCIDQAATFYQKYPSSHVKNEPKVDCLICADI